MHDVLDRLARRVPISARVAVVAAHPDDETIGAGASLHLLQNLLLVHTTDGAPRNLDDARAAGFDTSMAYADARRAELSAALAIGLAKPALAELHAPDQGASLDVARLAAGLVALLNQYTIDTVITHAYEGGHPDHDATAFAVGLAAARAHHRPVILEMAGYHANPTGGMRTGVFLPGDTPVTTVHLGPAEQAAKRRMLDCFVTQRATLAPFGVMREAFRPAPGYDFHRPPHPGKLHYENYDWGMTGAQFRALAAQAA